ncbi:MAG: AIR synthase related protein [Desulfobulbales bacterium]
MNSEEHLIHRITEMLPAAPERLTPVFSSDCELAKIEGVSLLCTLDDFSAEDLFFTGNPDRLGWNIACAALADIFACGGVAKLYSHSFVPDSAWNTHYIEKFMNGVSSALRECGAGFLGGDLGLGNAWRYTSHVIGQLRNRMVDRRGARSGDTLYLSGPIGLGNLEAALQLYGKTTMLQKLCSACLPKFRLLHQESALVARFASAAIDTSDGFASSILQLANQSRVGFVVETIPYHSFACKASRLLGKPRIMSALGGCGEYELLFTVPHEHETLLHEQAQNSKLTLCRIGTIIDGAEAPRIVSDGQQTMDFSLPVPQARDFKSLHQYLQALEHFARGRS